MFRFKWNVEVWASKVSNLFASDRFQIFSLDNRPNSFAMEAMLVWEGKMVLNK